LSKTCVNVFSLTFNFLRATKEKFFALYFSFLCTPDCRVHLVVVADPDTKIRVLRAFCNPQRKERKFFVTSQMIQKSF